MEAAEDLVQEVLTQAWQKLPSLHDPTAFLAWIKAIMANACRSWHRRAHARPAFLEEQEDALPADRQQQPLEALLIRERQRALRQALGALPETNRLALMMHLWGDYSYQEIAGFTGVPVTTVEGRIHRAKRQLRRLLRDEDAGSLAPAPRTGALAATDRHVHPPSPIRRGDPMRKSTSQPLTDLTRPLALVLFSKQLSTLLDAGVSLMRSLEILQEGPPPYGQAARELRAQVAAGGTLSQAMAERPELFSRCYHRMVRAGEVGAMLEEIFGRLADLMTREWKLARSGGKGEAPLLLVNPGGPPPPADWAQLSDYQKTVLRVLFCETLGLLLVSGVPMLQALDLLAELLPVAQREALRAVRDAVREGDRMPPILKQLGILPGFALEMIALGEETGSLDRALERAADVFQHELECRALLVS